MIEQLRDRFGHLPQAARGAVMAAGGLLVAVAVAWIALEALGLREDPREIRPLEIVAVARGEVTPSEDPFTYTDERRRELERAAAAGNSHVLYAKSPGGILASAKRTARWRPEIEAAAAERGTDPDLMEAMVLLESAGRPEVIAGSDPEAASGLAQILAGTGSSLLGMEIDLARSRELTSEIAAASSEAAELRSRAERADNPRKAAKLERRAAARERELVRARRERRSVDPRFDPEAALAGMARYLEIGSERFGRDDLAVASYHMGIGNLETAIDRYVSPGDTSGPTREVVDREGLSYAEIYFDSAPDRNPRTWRFLSGLGDDSSTYLWRVLAARQVMELYRSDREALAELARLHGAKATAEEVFHPREETKVFEDAGAIRDAIDGGDLVTIPTRRGLGFEVGRQLGQVAEELGEERSTYRALTPKALAVLVYIGARVRDISGVRKPLKVTSAVRDLAYQDALVGRNVQATRKYSLHTTGNSFDILRRYANDRQAAAFQFTLDRLKAHGMIDYALEPAAIHITVSDRAEALLE